MYIGVDLGGTNIAVGLVDEAGKIIKSASTPTNAPRSAEEIAKDIAGLCKSISEEAEAENLGKIEGIGVGVPGPVDEKLASVYVCVNLGWDEVNLKAILEEMTGYPVFIDNDANLAALAELEVGAFKGAQNAILFTLGTGVGGGVVTDGHIYRGSHGLGTELGHLYMGENFYDCNCGKNGCLETFASATAIIKHAEKLIIDKVYPESELNRLYNQHGLNAKAIFDCAKDGDALAVIAVERYTKYLAAGIGNMINLLDPDVIALGGGVAYAGEYLMNKINEKLPYFTLMKDKVSTELKFAATGNDAGVIGAGMLAKTEL